MHWEQRSTRNCFFLRSQEALGSLWNKQHTFIFPWLCVEWNKANLVGSIFCVIPSRELTSPSLGKGNWSSKIYTLVGYMLVPRRVFGFASTKNGVSFDRFAAPDFRFSHPNHGNLGFGKLWSLWVFPVASPKLKGSKNSQSSQTNGESACSYSSGRVVYGKLLNFLQLGWCFICLSLLKSFYLPSYFHTSRTCLHFWRKFWETAASLQIDLGKHFCSPTRNANLCSRCSDLLSDVNIVLMIPSANNRVSKRAENVWEGRIALTSASSPKQMLQFQDLEVYDLWIIKIVVWKLPTFAQVCWQLTEILPEMTKIISNDTPSTEAQAVMIFFSKWTKIIRCAAESALRRSQVERACHTRTWHFFVSAWRKTPGKN